MSDYGEGYPVVIVRQGGGAGSFIVGALIGAGVALLLAPRTGRETREDLKAGVTRLRDRAEEGMRGVQESVTGTIDTVKGEVTERIDAARDAFEAGRQAARDTRRDMERRVQDARTRARAGLDAALHPTENEEHSAGENASDSESGFGV